MTPSRRPFALAWPLAGLASASAFAQQAPVSEQLDDPKFSDVQVVGHVLEPSQRPTDIGALQVPPGFEINVFARDLINPRMLAVHNNGTVYVTRRKLGDVVMLKDTDGDGQADQQQVVANRPNMHGIALDGDTLYLVTIKELYRAQIKPDGTLEPLERLASDLPDAGQHPNRTLVVGPDKQLYLSVGSTCNACAEDNPENATLLRVKPDGSSRSIYASGLRNTIGFGFEPDSGALYGFDHGIDWLGDNTQHEELNLIERGRNYGWPYVYGDGELNPADEPPGNITARQWAERSAKPVGLYTPHAAPMQMTFYTGDAFPEAYRGDAFVTMRGSWNRKPPSGYEITRIRFDNGRPVAFEPFVTGFLAQEGDGWTQSARLAGIAQAGDGSLLFTDDSNGMIYRISHNGQEDAGAGESGRKITNADGAQVGMLPAATQGPQDEPEKPAQLSRTLLERDDQALGLTSSAFGDGQALPPEHAAEQDNVSPPLRWQAGPSGTQSYVVIMENPDVSSEPPFVHWLLYNLPADTSQLSAGLPGAPALEAPKGALQGRNDRGSFGYYGPRPPKDSPAHHYHFQVYALARLLELPFGASRQELLDAMRGHVLASDELIGTFKR